MSPSNTRAKRTAKSKPLEYAPTPAKRKKHGPIDGQELPTVEDVDGKLVGRCAPVEIDRASELLRSGVRVQGRRNRSPYPQSIYNVVDGIPHRAIPNAGDPNKFHAFPEPAWRVPPRVLEQLRNRAEESGHLPQFEMWHHEHPDPSNA